MMYITSHQHILLNGVLYAGTFVFDFFVFVFNRFLFFRFSFVFVFIIFSFSLTNSLFSRFSTFSFSLTKITLVQGCSCVTFHYFR